MVITVQLLTALGLAAQELWAAIPAGLAPQLHPVSVGFTAAIGAKLGALVVVLPGERPRTWLVHRHGRKTEKGPQGAIHKIWSRYGVTGLGPMPLDKCLSPGDTEGGSMGIVQRIGNHERTGTTPSCVLPYSPLPRTVPVTRSTRWRR